MKKVFLLVEDDADDTEIFCEALESIDPSIVCHCATDGHEALEILSTNEPPHLIFLDINMHGMNGWQCLNALKENELYKHIPVLMYSTSSHQREVDIALDLGALCFLTKPHNYGELKDILEVVADNVHKNLLEAISHLDAIRSKKVLPHSL